MDRLQTLYDDNPGITALQLYTKSLKEGLEVSRKTVTDFVNRQGDKQVLAQRKTPGGETGPRDDKEAQMDLIDMREYPSSGYKYIIVLIVVFTRKAYLKAITKKTPDVVERGLKTILDRTVADGYELQVISSDQGMEFTGKVSKLLQNKNIRHRLKATGDQNAIAVVDRLIGTLKLKFKAALTKQNKKRWDLEIKTVEDSYNTTRHGHLMGETPNNIPDVVKYELFEQSAAAIKKNNELNSKRTDKLLTTMHFRAPLPRKDFERAAEQRYGNIRVARKIEAGLVTDSQGTLPIKIVQVVPAQSTNVRPPGSAPAALKRKTGLQQYANALKTYLRQNGATDVSQLGKILNQEEGFKEAKGNISFLQFVQLFPMFKTSGSGRTTMVDLA